MGKMSDVSTKRYPDSQTKGVTRVLVHDRIDIRLKIKGDFLHFTCIRNEGGAKELGRGRKTWEQK